MELCCMTLVWMLGTCKEKWIEELRFVKLIWVWFFSFIFKFKSIWFFFLIGKLTFFIQMLTYHLLLLFFVAANNAHRLPYKHILLVVKCSGDSRNFVQSVPILLWKNFGSFRSISGVSGNTGRNSRFGLHEVCALKKKKCS